MLRERPDSFDAVLGPGRGCKGAHELAQQRRTQRIRQLLRREGFIPAEPQRFEHIHNRDACRQMPCPACGHRGLSYEPYSDSDGGFTCVSSCSRCGQLSETAPGRPLGLDDAADTHAALPQRPDPAKVLCCPGADASDVGCDERFEVDARGTLWVLNLARRRTGEWTERCPSCGLYGEDIIG